MPDQQALAKALFPIETAAEDALKKLLALRESQIHFGSYTVILQHLSQIKASLASIVDLINQNSMRDIENILLRMNDSLNQIGRHFPTNPPPPVILQIKELHLRLSKNLREVGSSQQTLNALQALAPTPNRDNVRPSQPGWIELLVQNNQQRGGNVHLRAQLPPPRSVCLAHIHSLLSSFPGRDQESLRREIHAVNRPPNGKSFHQVWSDLAKLLKEIRESHLQRKKEELISLQKTVEIFYNQTLSLESGYTKTKEQSRVAISQEIEAISGNVSRAKHLVNNAISPQIQLTKAEFGKNVGKWVGALIGSVPGGGLLSGGTIRGSFGRKKTRRDWNRSSHRKGDPLRKRENINRGRKDF